MDCDELKVAKKIIAGIRSGTLTNRETLAKLDHFMQLLKYGDQENDTHESSPRLEIHADEGYGDSAVNSPDNATLKNKNTDFKDLKLKFPNSSSWQTQSKYQPDQPQTVALFPALDTAPAESSVSRPMSSMRPSSPSGKPRTSNTGIPAPTVQKGSTRSQPQSLPFGGSQSKNPRKLSGSEAKAKSNSPAGQLKDRTTSTGFIPNTVTARQQSKPGGGQVGKPQAERPKPGQQAKPTKAQDGKKNVKKARGADSKTSLKDSKNSSRIPKATNTPSFNPGARRPVHGCLQFRPSIEAECPGNPLYTARSCCGEPLRLVPMMCNPYCIPTCGHSQKKEEPEKPRTPSPPSAKTSKSTTSIKSDKSNKSNSKKKSKGKKSKSRSVSPKDRNRDPSQTKIKDKKKDPKNPKTSTSKKSKTPPKSANLEKTKTAPNDSSDTSIRISSRNGANFQNTRGRSKEKKDKKEPLDAEQMDQEKARKIHNVPEMCPPIPFCSYPIFDPCARAVDVCHFAPPPTNIPKPDRKPSPESVKSQNGNGPSTEIIREPKVRINNDKKVKGEKSKGQSPKGSPKAISPKPRKSRFKETFGWIAIK